MSKDLYKQMVVTLPNGRRGWNPLLVQASKLVKESLSVIKVDESFISKHSQYNQLIHSEVEFNSIQEAFLASTKVASAISHDHADYIDILRSLILYSQHNYPGAAILQLRDAVFVTMHNLIIEYDAKTWAFELVIDKAETANHSGNARIIFRSIISNATKTYNIQTPKQSSLLNLYQHDLLGNSQYSSHEEICFEKEHLLRFAEIGLCFSDYLHLDLAYLYCILRNGYTHIHDRELQLALSTKKGYQHFWPAKDFGEKPYKHTSQLTDLSNGKDLKCAPPPINICSAIIILQANSYLISWKAVLAAPSVLSYSDVAAKFVANGKMRSYCSLEKLDTNFAETVQYRKESEEKHRSNYIQSPVWEKYDPLLPCQLRDFKLDMPFSAPNTPYLSPIASSTNSPRKNILNNRNTVKNKRRNYFKDCCKVM